VAEEERSQGPIIFGPDLISFGMGRCVRTGERPVKPFREPLSCSKKSDAAVPDGPITKIDIKFEVGRPGIVVDVLQGKDGVVRTKGRHSRCCCMFCESGSDGGQSFSRGSRSGRGRH